MPRSRIPLPRTGDRKTQATTDALARTARQSTQAAAPLFAGDGKEHALEYAATEVKTVHHGLSRQPRGWLFHSVESETGATLIGPYVVTGSANSDSLQAEVSTTAPVKCKLYVF